jgi:outer membrane protein assembly factor BamB
VTGHPFRCLLACLLFAGCWAPSAWAAEIWAPELAFRFSASSALFARPGVGHGGAVYVGSGDGYVHALAADGIYRWSYTVKGRVVAPPVEEPKSGRVFIATSEARLYALEPDSHLRWVFPLPVAPKTELSLSAKGTLYFVGVDDHLYGVTTSGALSLRLAASGVRSAPLSVASGQTHLVLNDSIATLKGYGYERAPLPGPFASAAKLALSADRAILACDNGTARVLGGGRPELSLKSDCLSPPVAGDGFHAIAEASGQVRLAFANGQSLGVTVGQAPLRPVWDAPRRRLVLASATGSLLVLSLPSGQP